MLTKDAYKSRKPHETLKPTAAPQALSALAQLPPATTLPAHSPLLAAVAASASTFPPHNVTKALIALEVLAASPLQPPQAALEPQGDQASV